MPGVDMQKPFPGIRQAIAISVGVVALQIGLSIPVAIVDALLGLGWVQHPGFMAVINSVSFLLIVSGCCWWSRMPVKAIVPLRRFRLALLWPMLLTIVGMGILVSELDNLTRSVFPPPDWLVEMMVNLTSAQKSVIGSFLVLVVVAPVTEEILFRGLILRGLLKRHALWVALGAQAILFSLIHLNPWQFATAGGLGVVFGWWYWRTGSLWPGLIGHAFHNLVVLIISANVDVEEYLHAPVEFQPLWLNILGAIMLVVGIVLFARKTPDLPWETERALEYSRTAAAPDPVHPIDEAYGQPPPPPPVDSRREPDSDSDSNRDARS